MRAARFLVSTELLETALQLPDGARIVDVVLRDDDRGIMEMTVEDPALAESAHPHDCDPTVTKHYVQWNWNITISDSESRT